MIPKFCRNPFVNQVLSDGRKNIEMFTANRRNPFVNQVLSDEAKIEAYKKQLMS